MGTRNPGQQALLVSAYLRKGETFAQLAAGFGIGTTTAWRYANETAGPLAARAPKLRTAIRAAGSGHSARLWPRLPRLAGHANICRVLLSPRGARASR